MPPAITCVVDTGMPRAVARNSEMAPPVSAAKPCGGSRWVRRMPMVRTMRHPPSRVPSPIAA
jgi:hypothetical protein